MSQVDVVIIGGGISGLSALHYVRRTKPELSVRLFEAESRLGGTIGTDNIDGYSFDWGPNGFLDREPLTLKLCEELGLNDDLERANENVANRFILRKGKLRSVPMKPPAFLMSDILSLKGRLRVMGEPFARSAPDDDESIYDFVQRRIGREAADYLVQPMVSGVFGGVADQLSLKSCFPIMREMEQEHGSLFKAMIAKARAAKAKGKKSGGPSGPGGWLTSFRGGLNRIVDQFHKRYESNITTGQSVTTITKENDCYRIDFQDGHTEQARTVIIAVPSNQAATLVESLSNGLAGALARIPYAPISVVCFGYAKENVGRSLDGFGFLVPSKEKRRILGSIWTSSIFDARAPEGKVQFRSMVGGDGDHASMELSDDELVRIVRDDLDGIVGLNSDPEVVKLYRWCHGIPQFKIGHSDILSEIETELEALGNIHVTGNAYYGIGLNDCVKQSHRVVSKL